jgi:hypothetical protein
LSEPRHTDGQGSRGMTGQVSLLRAREARQEHQIWPNEEGRGSGSPRTSSRWGWISVSDASKGICKGIIYGGNKQALI